MSVITEDTFYKDSLIVHIESLKTAIKMNTDVIIQPVEADLSEDKYVNVIKARRMASDDNLYYYEEIKRIEAIINDTDTSEKGDLEEGKDNPIGRHRKR